MVQNIAKWEDNNNISYIFGLTKDSSSIIKMDLNLSNIDFKTSNLFYKSNPFEK